MNNKSKEMLQDATKKRNQIAFNRREKIPGKLVRIVNPDQFLYLVPSEKGPGFKIAGIKASLKAPFRILALALTANPKSHFASSYRANSGMDARKSSAREVKQFLRKENTKGGVDIAWTEEELFDDSEEVHIKHFPADVRHTVVLPANALDENGDLTRFFFMPQELLLLKPYAASVAEKRGCGVSMIENGASRLAKMRRAGIVLSSLYKTKGDTITVSLVKASSRLKLSASSSKDFPIFGENTRLVSIEKREFFDWDKSIVEAFIYEIAYVINGVEMRKFVMEVQDFTVRIAEDILMSIFKDGNISMEERKEIIERLVTDGAIYIDADWMKSLGMDNSFQVRFTGVVKGMANCVPELFDVLGVDMVMFGGAVKGAVSDYFRAGIFDLSVLNIARDAKTADAGLIVSQQLLANICDDESSSIVKDETMKILHGLYSYNPQALKEFLGAETAEETDTDEVTADLSDVDNLTLAFLELNPEKFIKSGTNQKRLNDLIQAATKGLRNGRTRYIPNTLMLHMTVDPFTIMRLMKSKHIGVDASKVKRVGIRRKRTIWAQLKGSGIDVVSLKAILGRYPNLHTAEIRVTNSDQENHWSEDKVTYDYYTKWMRAGFFQGLIIYSLWDIEPEGQSGADFDGDQTVVICFEALVNHFAEQQLFLDMSEVDGKVISGAIQGSGYSFELKEKLSPQQLAFMEKNNVQLVGDELKFPKELGDNEQLLNILADLLCEAGFLTTVENNIGLYTNIGSMVHAMIAPMERNLAKARFALAEFALMEDFPNKKQIGLEMESKVALLEVEVKGYKKLELLLAIAIRWEIDKAKHGGAYLKYMPFLRYFGGIPAEWDYEMVSEVMAMEKHFGISLRRLLGSLA